MRAALLQSCTGIDPAAGRAVLADAIAEAGRAGAHMLFTPEMSGFLDRDKQRASAHLAPEREDRTLAAVREAAARTGIWVHLGSLALRSDDPAEPRLVNRGFVIDATGAIRARYDKIHLFDVDVPGGVRWRESESYAPGSRAVVVDVPDGRLGLSICYDVRFPDLYSALAQAGAQILSIPAAFTVPTGRAHWHVLLRARAIETGSWVIAAAQSGLHEDGRSTYGHSLVVDPWGNVVLDMEDEAGIAYAEIDLGQGDEVRAQIPVLRHRRTIGEVEIAR